MVPGQQRAQHSDPLPGEVLAQRYLLRREIARGGMGTVFEAEHVFTGRRLAIKLVRADQAHVTGLSERLLEEARMLGTISHPGIVEVHDAGIDADGRAYVAMELLEGRTLEGILTVRGRLPIADTVQIGVQICEALAFVHTHGVVHRDLKPGNIFIVRDRKGHEAVKLIDFGVATYVTPGSQATRPSASGGPTGTIAYMSLEQLLARPVDRRSDVYATAVTLYECLAGQVPLLGNYGEILSALATRTRPQPMSTFRRDVSPMLGAALEAALAGEMLERTPDALTFARALLDGAEMERGESSVLGLGANEGLRGDAASQPAQEENAGEAPVLLARRRAQPIELQRRRSPRLPYVTPVRLFRASEGVSEARCEEISSTGMLLLCAAAFRVGEIVTVQFAVPMTGAIATLEAVVRWIREARGRSALGIEFRSVPESARAPIAAFVDQPVAAAVG